MKCEKMGNIYAMNRFTVDDAGLQGQRHGGIRIARMMMGGSIDEKREW
jgi:hypothetical protein